MRRVWSIVTALIDSESVRPLQYLVVYAFTVGAGVQCAIMNPPGAVTRVMGDHWDTVWTATLIVFPLTAYIGAWLRPRRQIGLYVHLAADAGFTLSMLAYVAALVQATYAQSATVAAWLAAAMVTSGATVTIRDVRLIREVKRQRALLGSEGAS